MCKAVHVAEVRDASYWTDHVDREGLLEVSFASPPWSL